jgi:hypothetical protein
MPTAEQQQVREGLIDRLRLDLLGPSTSDEVLVQDRETREGDTPLSRYLVGILYPSNSLVAPEEDDPRNPAGDGDEEDEAPEAPVQMTGIPKPSSIGLSFAVASDVRQLWLEFRCGLYAPVEAMPPSPEGNDTERRRDSEKRKPTILWKRTQIVESITPILGSSGVLKLPRGGRSEWLCRRDGNLLAVSVFLRNTNPGGPGPDHPEQCLYQPEIIVSGVTPENAPIVNRAHRANRAMDDPDLESYRLLYRDRPEFGVGHGCATIWVDRDCPPDRARMIRTELLPVCEVVTTEARGDVGLPGLNIETLASAADGRAIELALSPLADQCQEWIHERRNEVSDLAPAPRPKATEHLDDCEEALRRIREGLDLITTDPLVFEALRFANRAMMLQRQKSVEAANFQRGRGRTYNLAPPAWRPFQIAFFLLNLKGIAAPGAPDREIVDLLWSPAGSGKTEAYLGLAAFTMALRRLRHARNLRPDASGDGGVTVLMRYTLRLRTIQQFQRTATLLCACEVLRRQEPEQLGREPFSIGLWVGGGATPNQMGRAQYYSKGCCPESRGAGLASR